MKIVEQAEEIFEYFSKIAGLIAKETGNVIETVEAHRLHVSIALSDEYKLVLFEHDIGTDFQIRLEPAGKQAFLVEFGFGPNRRSKFACDNDGEIYILREVLALSGGYRPNFGVIEVQSKRFYVICSLSDFIGSEIVRFYEDATGRDLPLSDKWTADYGVDKEYNRAGCTVIPKHHPVAKTAEAYLKDNGFTFLLATGCRPDFFVRKNGRTAVVEVKPDLKQQSIATAIGQLLLYKLLASSDDMILILPQDEGFEAIKSQIAKIDPRMLLVSVPPQIGNHNG